MAVYSLLRTPLPHRYIDFVFYVIFYMIYVIMSMILLLNLLIAMMGDTFSNTMSASTLEWRVDFARRVPTP